MYLGAVTERSATSDSDSGIDCFKIRRFGARERAARYNGTLAYAHLGSAFMDGKGSTRTELLTYERMSFWHGQCGQTVRWKHLKNLAINEILEWNGQNSIRFVLSTTKDNLKGGECVIGKTSCKRGTFQKCHPGPVIWVHCLWLSDNQNSRGNYTGERTIYLFRKQPHFWFGKFLKTCLGLSITSCLQCKNCWLKMAFHF